MNARKYPLNLILTRVSRVICVFVLIGCLVSLSGWILNISALSKPFPDQEPLYAGDAAALILLAVAILASGRASTSRIFTFVQASSATFAAVLAALAVYDHSVPAWRVSDIDLSSLQAVIHWMTMSTLMSVLVFAMAVAVLLRNTRYLFLISEVIMVVVLCASSFGLIDILYSTPLSYAETCYINLSILSASYLVLLSWATFLTFPDRGLAAIFASETHGGVAARRLLPAAIVIPCLLGFLQILGKEAHLYESVFGTSILILTSILLISSVVLLVASRLDRLEKRRQESEELSRLILEKSYEAFISFDSTGKIIEWNKQAEQLFGYAKSEIEGRKITKIIYSAEDKALIEEGLQSFRTTGASRILNTQFEMKGLHRDSHQIPVELSITPVQISSESTEIFCSFLRDISERYRSAEELAQARDQAIQASRFKSEFLANMSHEIRTPLNAVIGMSDLLDRTHLSEEQREFASVIHNSADALLDIVNDILDYSKIEAGKISLEITEFDVVSVVEGSADLLAGKAREKALSLMTYVSPEIPPVRGDPGRIRQILMNLVGNGIKFTESGEVAVHAILDRLDALTANVRITVTDTGIGLTEEAIQHLFRPFTQIDGSITRRYGGTGLGLSICKRLVELMDGEIGVESMEGAGSTFWFTVPLERSPGKSADAPPKELSQVRMLVAGGPPEARQIVQAYADQWGMICDAENDPSAMIERLKGGVERSEPYQIAVLDCNGNGSQALDLGKKVQDDSAFSSTRLILLTSTEKRGLGIDALASGYSAYLNKPVKRSRLMDCMTGVLKTKGRSSPASVGTTTVPDLAPIEVVPFAPEKKPLRLADASLPNARLVLVVEDNTVNQKVALLLLRELGFNAHAVGNGSEAVEAIDRADYCLILMDCQMPEMDGLECTRLIRKKEALTGKHVPIVAMTAHAMSEDRYKCIAAGMDDYISKPVSRNVLKHVLERHMPVESAQTPPEVIEAEPETMSEPEPMPIERLRESFGDALIGLCVMFVSETERIIVALDEAISDRNAKKVRALSHELKGACASLHASELVRVTKAMEQAAVDNNWGTIEESQPHLKEAASQVKHFLEERELLKEDAASQAPN